MCRVKYNNHLPDIPFDAKFIAYPFEANRYEHVLTIILCYCFKNISMPATNLNNLFRFVQYKPTSLEKNYKHELLTEVDLGVNIDLIDPDTYAMNPEGRRLHH